MTATLDTQALKQLDQAHHLHPFTDFGDYAQHGGRIVSRAEHVYIYDSDGNKIQDGMSGLWCCNLGYSQDRIKQAQVRTNARPHGTDCGQRWGRQADSLCSWHRLHAVGLTANALATSW